MLRLLYPAEDTAHTASFGLSKVSSRKHPNVCFMDTLIVHMGLPRKSQRQGGGGDCEELFIWVDSCLLLQMGLLFIMYPLLPGAQLAPCSRKFFVVKPHHCSAAEHLLAVAISSFTPKLWDEAGDN